MRATGSAGDRIIVNKEKRPFGASFVASINTWQPKHYGFGFASASLFESMASVVLAGMAISDLAESAFAAGGATLLL
jgi:hypothetical protein